MAVGLPRIPLSTTSLQNYQASSDSHGEEHRNQRFSYLPPSYFLLLYCIFIASSFLLLTSAFLLFLFIFFLPSSSFLFRCFFIPSSLLPHPSISLFLFPSLFCLPPFLSFSFTPSALFLFLSSASFLILSLILFIPPSYFLLNLSFFYFYFFYLFLLTFLLPSSSFLVLLSPS